MKTIQNNLMRGHRIKIAQCIFEGMTLVQIAMEIGITKSCVCYHIKHIYKKYNAKTRTQFIRNFFTNMLEKYKATIGVKDEQFGLIEKENNEMKIILSELLFNKNNPENFNCWELKAKKYL